MPCIRLFAKRSLLANRLQTDPLPFGMLVYVSFRLADLPFDCQKKFDKRHPALGLQFKRGFCCPTISIADQFRSIICFQPVIQLLQEAQKRFQVDQERSQILSLETTKNEL